VLRDMITTEHYHDLGKLLFAFTVFWAYIAFSQFFLIWYGNIPEETAFYVKRFQGSWATVGTVVLFGHFVFPFLCLISRIPKRNPRSLALVALWMLTMHYIDLYYLIMPNFSPAGIAPSWQDATSFVGVGGIFIWLFWRKFLSAPVIPVNDPQLQTSVEFTNA